MAEFGVIKTKRFIQTAKGYSKRTCLINALLKILNLSFIFDTQIYE